MKPIHLLIAALGIAVLFAFVNFVLDVKYPFRSNDRAMATSYNLRYRMTVTVETPEGLKSGSAVRAMSNGASSAIFPGVGNPAEVRGEAVAVDMGERGVLFALISHKSDLEFYNAFPVPGDEPRGGGDCQGHQLLRVFAGWHRWHS